MGEAEHSGFLDRTLENLRGAWRELAGSARQAVGAGLRRELPPEDAARLAQQMRECLEGRGGEVSARARAAALGRAYLDLNEVGRARFLRLLADDFGTDPAAVDAAVAALSNARDPNARRIAERQLRRALEPPRLRLLRQFNELPQGVKFLVDTRAELLSMSRDDPSLAALEADLEDLLTAWFDIGFLTLERITWESPAALLEKLIGYEAVHAIQSWDDLKNRLASDRRCFAYFHPRMPDEPLIFVEVALVNGMADSVQVLLDEGAPLLDPQSADTAIFYSISNAQRGLAGISFGGFLIKRVVDRLAAEFGGLKRFATLSPAPRFRRWLEEQFASDGDSLLTVGERQALTPFGGQAAIPELLDRPGWDTDAALAEVLRPPLLRLCAQYLANETTPDGRALDRVAHFHLSNGARVERLNWLADRSAKGMQQSAGIMINYDYKLGRIETNHEAYTGSGQVAISSAIRGLLKG